MVSIVGVSTVIQSTVWNLCSRLVLAVAHNRGPSFATLYGMRMFLFLAGILMGAGVVIALYFSGMFSLGAWIAGLTLFVFAWIGRSIATSEAKTHVATGAERTQSA